MAQTLRHRGPDDSGAWADPAAGIALGHQRLAIIDLSVEGHQPMFSASGRYCVVFNGEIYNYADIRLALGQSDWRGHSDTEVMLAAFERWGVEEALRRFNGMFAFALWDRAERTLYLARDRIGEKPLYYGSIGETFAFASELKALRAHPSWKAEVDRDALASFLRHGYVPGPYSIYRGIRKLQPGCWIKVSAGEHEPVPRAYWSMREAAERGFAAQIGADEKAATDELEALLRDSVALRMVADVPVGVFLSGGIDSSTVAALMQSQSDQPVKSFSIGFDEPGYDEAPYAKAVAEHLRTDHTELYVRSDDALQVIPRLATVYDEPFADASQIPTILVSELARRDVTVSLSGDGGDEFFCGYSRYFWSRYVWRRVSAVPRALRKLAAHAAKACSPAGWDTVLAALRPFVPATPAGTITGDRIHKFAEILQVGSPDELYQGLTWSWPQADSVVLGARDVLTAHNDPREWPQRADFASRMMFVDGVTYLPDDILVKTDRAAMSVGLEARVPLLDHRVVEYAWRVPLSLKVRGNTGKWLLREVLYRYVPRELVDRPKMGFGVPIHAWLRGPLREYAEDLLSERALQRGGYFEPAAIRQKWSEHLSGTRNWEYWLWSVLVFQAWERNERGF